MTMQNTTTTANATATAADTEFDPGFDVGATLKDYLRDRRIEKILSPRSRRPRRNRASVPVRLTEDGRIDKQSMREERLFGRTPLYV